MTQQELHEVAQGTRAPEEVSMTLAEFLENDVDGYEYVKGELVPMSPLQEYIVRLVSTLSDIWIGMWMRIS